MAGRYTYRAEWSHEDEEYVGLVAEFPSLSWLAPTAAEAIAGIENVVAEVVEDLVASDEPVPAPLAERRYSGKIAFRTTAELHRRLTIDAAEQGVSVNQWMNQKLSEVAALVSESTQKPNVFVSHRNDHGEWLRQLVLTNVLTSSLYDSVLPAMGKGPNQLSGNADSLLGIYLDHAMENTQSEISALMRRIYEDTEELATKITETTR